MVHNCGYTVLITGMYTQYIIYIFIYTRSHHLLCGIKIRVLSRDGPKKSTSAGQAYLALRAISVQRLSNNNVLAVQAAFNPDAPSIASGNLTGYC